MKNRVDTVKQQPPTVPLAAQNTIAANQELRTKSILILFFLSATWRVYPYFYGSDIVFIFCWITLLIAGPYGSILPSLDTLLAVRLLKFLSTQQRARVAPLLHFILGTGETSHDKSGTYDKSGYLLPRQGAYNAPPAANNPQNKQIPTNMRRNYRAEAALKKQGRRSFLWGVVSGGAGMLGLVWLSSLFHTAPQTPNSPASNAVATAPQATDTATSATPQTPGVIAQVSQVPANSAADFTLPSNGDPGVLVHLDNGRFVAYDAACTHAGCPVSYDPGSKLLLCPCHGAAFDPAKDAAVVQGPAQTPLTSVPIRVDNASGAISLSS